MSKAGIPVPNQKGIHQEVQDFFLNWIQSLLTTNYYDPSHPEGRRALNKIFHGFQRAIREGSNKYISFTLLTGGDRPDVIIDGLEGGPYSLREVLPTGMGDLYLPKFSAYMDRRKLASISLLPWLTWEELGRFFEVMNGKLTGSVEEQNEYIKNEFEKRDVRNVRLIFKEDFVGAMRKLSYRVNLALTKLVQDFRLIMAVQDQNPLEIEKVKPNLYSEALKGLINQTQLYEALINIDLVDKAIGPNKHIHPSQEVIEYLDDRRVIPLLEFMMQRLDVFENPPAGTDLEILDFEKHMVWQLLPRLARRFIRDMASKQIDLVEILLVKQIIHIGDLPENMRETFVKRMLVVYLEQDPEGFFQFLEGARLTSFLREADYFLKLLTTTDRHLLAFYVIQFLVWTADNGDTDEDRQLARAGLISLNDEGVIENLLRWFEGAKKEEREPAVELLMMAGNAGLRLLIEFLKRSNDRWLRKFLIDCLATQGQVVVDYLVRQMENEKLEWFQLRNFLDILGQVADMSQGPRIEKFLHHEDPRVRMEAAHAYHLIMGGLALPELARLLRDPDDNVRYQAIKEFEAAPESDDAFDLFIERVLRDKENRETNRVLIGAIRCLVTKRHIMKVDVEDVLIAALERKVNSLAGISLGGGQAHDVKVRASAAEALGQLRSQRALPALLNLQKEKNEELTKSAQVAIRNIQNASTAGR
ncbi:MAG: hypothetical protein GMKNLPBB_00829 [Myxococcota bacterium]|nr:hypothetical protein [Myxococcota bacterium]